MWLLAAATALVHGLLAGFLVAGAPFAARRPRLMAWYLIMLVPTTVVNLGRFPCPLTVLEKHFWRLAGETPYRGGFISRYFVEPFHSGGLSPTAEDLLLILMVVWCGSWLLYSAGWHLWRRLRRGAVRQSDTHPILDAGTGT